MAKRKLNLRATAFGFTTVIAKVNIAVLADEIKGDATTTDLVCHKCNQKPEYKGGYVCSCGEKYGHWKALKRVLKGTFTELVKNRLSNEKETMADLYKMSLTEFAEHVDATRAEHGITVKDESSSKNLYKLLVATKKLEVAIIVIWKDTYEEKIALLTTSLSGRIILREIIPRNLAILRETLKVDKSKITATDVKEAEEFLKQIPDATHEMFDVSDYRTTLTVPQKVQAVKAPEQVQDLKTILAKAKK